jgi:pimeloyl-ACP methyl ester carboxylesterase
MKLAVLIALSIWIKGCVPTIFECYKTTEICPNNNITFYLYTRNSENNPQLLDLRNPESVIQANFIKNKKLIFLIHGYTGDKDYSPNSHIRPALFQKDDFNVISIDYSPLAKYPCYFSAVGNLPTVANCSAQFLDFIIDNELFDIDSIHVIGFSLGAQASFELNKENLN